MGSPAVPPVVRQFVVGAGEWIHSLWLCRSHVCGELIARGSVPPF
jgi:hypothetical protein